ncbi:polysaccharide lyase family 1 protein [Treponema saccharophilum]|uniref:pectate lyase family protein n=1 Tax=Treponema saccharophilum TaxID=165 RepID=UPI00386ED957
MGIFLRTALKAALISALVFAGCASDNSSDSDIDSLTGVSISGNEKVLIGQSATLTAAPKKTGKPEISYSWSLSSDVCASLSAPTGESVELSVRDSASEGDSVKVTVTATWGTVSVKGEKTVTFSTAPKLSLTDKPVGYASITPQTGTGATVTTKTELVNALKNGGLIYVSGTIDVSEGCLPSEAGGTTPQLDAFVAANSDFSTYTAFKTAYAGACSSSTNDKSSGSPESTYGSVMWTLNKAYGNKIKLSPISNTTIIGLDGAVIKGGTFQISGVSNVTIRNLTIQDAYDPFPHHEENDGFNAQWDGICLDGASNIWIDHCTIEDTMKYSKVAISGDAEEKWQTYDGLCDMKGSSKNIVVSYCIFKNHDKTMLIGSGSGDTSGGYITIHHNKFLNCGQRLPMTTYPNMHIYNNSYERDSDAYYSQQASIAARYGAYTIIAENNYFGSGVKYCISQSTSPSGKCYESGNVFTSRSEGSKALSTQDTKPFTPSYEYELDEASDVPTIIEEKAGAGCSVSGI